MQAEYLDLDKEAVEHALKIVNNVLTRAKKQAEKQVKKEGKSEQELKKSIQNVQQKWIETLERLVTKTLGVLQEQGVYAMLLFLFSRTGDEKEVAPIIREQLYESVKKLPNFTNLEIDDESKSVLNIYTKNVLSSIDILLLVRDLYEQTLIYARYAAKAEGNKEKGG
ncbi:MAG: hypothetical protein QM438_11095 [Euryarchaeota archaeon]|nr:hypothetical protein [Euryarchaeota archaeon]